jgi:diacylglycerol kinase (ATP)
MQVKLSVHSSDHSNRPRSKGTVPPDLLLANPAAGGGLGREILPDLERFAATHNWAIELILTRSPADFTRRAQQAAAAGRERIFAVGGDGTFQLLVNAVQGFPQTVLAVIPAGGGNDLAAALDLPDAPLVAAELLLRGEICELDAVRVRTAEGNERLYTGGGGVGLDAEAARYASGAYRNLRGRLRYLLSAISALAGYHAINTTITTGDGEAPLRMQKALLAGVLNTPSYGAGLALAPDARTDDGKLDLVLLEDLSLWEILALLPSLAVHGELKTKQLSRRSVDCLRIETDPPRNFHGDGEILGTTPVEISVVPRACRVLRASRTNSSSDRASGSG